MCPGCASSISLWLMPSLARDEDHPRRGQARHVHRVVAGARDGGHVRVPEPVGARSTAAMQSGWKGRRVVRDLPIVISIASPTLGGDLRADAADVGVHRRARFVGRVAEVDRELDAPRDHVAAVRMHLHHADRAAAVGGWRWAQATTSCISLGWSTLERVPAQRHRRRAGVRFMPVTTQSYQRMPSTPVTTPIVLSLSSSTGPCSMGLEVAPIRCAPGSSGPT